MQTTDLAPNMKTFDPTQGRDELNLAEFPLYYMGQRVPAGLTTLTFENEISDPVRNRKVKRKIELVASDSTGIPICRDMDVLHALIAVGKHTNDLASPVIHFSRYQLCEILGWTKNGKSYKRIEEALRKWVTVTLFFESWWDKDQDGWRNLKGFHILDDIELNETTGRKSQQSLPFSSVRLGDRIFQSLHAGNVKRLNLVDVFHLTLPTAKRLYSFLDKRFYHNPVLSFDLRTLACEHVGLSRDYKTSQLKRKLQPAIDELISIGFIDEIEDDQRYTKIAHGVWRVCFQRTTREKIGTLPLSGSKSERSENRQLIKALTDHGVTASTARQLVENPAIANDQIRLQIEILEWKIEDDNEDAPGKPGGYLRKAIEDGYDPPKNFKPKAEREAETQRVIAAQKKRQVEQDARRRHEDQKQIAEAAARAKDAARVDDYLASLPAGDREKLIDEAIEQCDGMMKSYAVEYRRNPKAGLMREAGYKTVIQNHVLPLLATTSE